MELVVTPQLGTSVLFLFLCVLVNTVSAHSFPCNKTGGICGCVFTKNGTQYEITMSGVNRKDGKPYFSSVKGSSGYWNYDFNPCTTFSVDDCKGVTGCQFAGNASFSISNAEILSFSDYIPDKPLVVTYKNTPKGRHTTVSLIYEEGEDHINVDDSKENVYAIRITSSKVGPQAYQPPPRTNKSSKLSTGSILVIIFFVLLTVYLIAGILFMKYKRGATGKEVIPNVEFWSSLPGLVKDGCVFFGSKMKQLCQRTCQRGSYDEI